MPIVTCMYAVLKESVNAWFEQRAASKGAALAFYTLFSMAPILLLAIAVAGYFFGAEAAQGEIFSQLRMLVGPNGAQAIQALLAAAQDPSSGLIAILIGSVLLIVGATSVFVELKGSLDELWGVDKPGRSGLALAFTSHLRSFMLVLFLGLMLMVSLVAGATLAVLERYVGGFWSSASVVLA